MLNGLFSNEKPYSKKMILITSISFTDFDRIVFQKRVESLEREMRKHWRYLEIQVRSHPTTDQSIFGTAKETWSFGPHFKRSAAGKDTVVPCFTTLYYYDVPLKFIITLCGLLLSNSRQVKKEKLMPKN